MDGIQLDFPDFDPISFSDVQQQYGDDTYQVACHTSEVTCAHVMGIIENIIILLL